MKYPFHPLSFALFPLLFIYAHNISQLSFFRDVLPIFLIVLLVTLALITLSFLVFKDWHKGCLAVSIVVVFFFSFGYFIIPDSVTFTIGPFIIGPNKIKFLLWLPGILGGCFLVYKYSKPSENLTKILNVSASTMLLLALFSIFQYNFNATDIIGQENNSGGLESGILEKPDIYYIILDEYAGKQTLKNGFGFDNSHFYSELVARNFDVLDPSFTNYGHTALSLASSLNMRYLDDVAEQVGKDDTDWAPTYALVQDSEIVKRLKALGYTFILLRSGWSLTNFNKYADQSFPAEKLNEFATIVAYTTMLNPFVDSMVANSKKEMVLYALDNLPEIAKNPASTFTFVHLISPHQPYVFGPDGESVSGIYDDLRVSARDEDGLGTWTEVRKNLYIGEVQFLDKRIIEVIDGLLEKSDTPPIIIIQSDHGSKANGNLDFPSEALYKERMENLNAVFFPEHKDSLKNLHTPVNTFRILLNAYFGGDYNILPDKMYFSTLDRPFDFLNVTDIVSNIK